MGKLLLLMAASEIVKATGFVETITVHVHNRAASAAVMSKGEREASYLLERVGIAVRWTDILTADPGRGVEQIRQEPDDPSHFTITVDNKFLHLSITDTALGFAMPLAGNRAQAGVVYRAVERVAQDNRDLISCGLLLGVVLAHEIAHLLLGSVRHGLGLLQANWTRTELKRMAQHQLLFLPEQGEALRRGLRARYVVPPWESISRLERSPDP